MTIFLPQRKRIDVDNYVMWDTTTDYGYFTSRESIDGFIASQDEPGEWNWDEIDLAQGEPDPEAVADELVERMQQLTSEIELGMNCSVVVSKTPGKGAYVQIECYREDTITKKMGTGRGGKAYPSEHSTDSEIFQIVFGLYKGYWEHEARETFVLRGRRPFGPHIATEALLTVARKVDVRSQKHEEDKA
jgi:hypothetical protein